MQFYTFGLGQTYVSEDVTPASLGGKGAGLVWMSDQGVPVPPGFVIPVSVWAEYDKKPKTTLKLIAKMLPEYLASLKVHFGYMPLLSVRSGSRLSCPGMMDTILNVGIDATTKQEWFERLGAEAFANSLHRLVVMYGSVVKGIRRDVLEPNLMTALSAYANEAGSDFPDASTQLLTSIEAVFKSWDNERAKVYRKMNSIPRQDGTAVTVQAMVFGNLNAHSGTGVLFTRNPDTGKREVTGEFLVKAQGEDIVAGTRTPLSLGGMSDWALKIGKPELFMELMDRVIELEKLKKDVQDIEFTVQDGKLYLLQIRTAKRSVAATIRIALDMAKEGLISSTDAIRRVSIKEFDQAQLATIDPKWTKPAAFTGIPASSGVVSGKPVFSKEAAINCKEPCILVTQETTPDDIAGMAAAAGVITMVGGFTSHAAVISRPMNRACIVGVGQSVDAFKDVEVLSMDGGTGQIWTEVVPIIGAKTNGLIHEYGQLVFDLLGAIPILSEPPKGQMECALLYLGDTVLQPKVAVAMVIKTLEKVSRLYLDLTPEPDGAEAEYFSICEGYQPAVQVVAELEQALLPTARERVTLLAGAVPSSVFRVVDTQNPATSLRGVILADKEILLRSLDQSDPVVQKVLLWKQQDGVQLVSVGQIVPGMKSMVSLSQALQVVQEGGGVSWH